MNPVESHRTLTGNFRSSPAICRLAATLRNIDQVDESVGDTANVAHPALLLVYGGRGPSAAIGRAFLDRVTELGLDSADAIVLAHSGKVAQRAAGDVSSDSNGSSRVESLARKVAEFWSPAATGAIERGRGSNSGNVTVGSHGVASGWRAFTTSCRALWRGSTKPSTTSAEFPYAPSCGMR